jgi:hypothetical protein
MKNSREELRDLLSRATMEDLERIVHALDRWPRPTGLAVSMMLARNHPDAPRMDGWGRLPRVGAREARVSEARACVALHRADDDAPALRAYGSPKGASSVRRRDASLR